MRVRLTPFLGMIPRRDARLMEQRYAQAAVDVRLTSGALEAYRQTRTVQQDVQLSAGEVASIARWRGEVGSEWLRFPSVVSVVRGPVSGDVWERVYWTGDSRYGQPMYAWAGNIEGSEPPSTPYKLGVPAPEDAPHADPIEPPQGSVAAVHADERPIRVVTENPHGLETGEIVRFDITAGEPGDDEEDLGDFLSTSEGFQVEATGGKELRLENTDGTVRDYSGFESGTWEVYIAPEVQERRFYVHTYVTELGEEGPPSPPSTAIDAGTWQEVSLSIPPLDPEAGQGRLIRRRRIYRTAAGSRGAAFQFVDEIDLAAESYTDVVKTEDLAETISSTAYDPPPSGLSSLDVLPTGSLVGAYQQDVCFSEPYLPHAWPAAYRLTLDHPIVAVAVFDTHVVATTEGRPYLITGADPRSMAPTRLPVTQGCVSARSVVSLGYAVVYASVDGLVMVDNNGARLITRDVISPQEWAGYAPESMHGYEHEGRCVLFYNTGERRGALVIDPRNPEGGVLEWSLWARSGYRDPADPYLYLLTEAGDIVQWDAGDETLSYRWRSAVLPIPYSVAPSCAEVWAHSYDDTTLRLFIDGELVVERSIMGSGPMRLPPRRGRELEVEIEGTDTVQEVVLADSVGEMRHV